MSSNHYIPVSAAVLHLQLGQRFLMLLYVALVINRTQTFESRWGTECETDCGGAISRGDPTSMPESPDATPSTETID